MWSTMPRRRRRWSGDPSGRPLAEQQAVRDGLTSEQLESLLDPTRYVGVSAQLAEQGAARARETADSLG